MEPDGSLACSQEPDTDPYPESKESSPHLPNLFPWDTSNTIFPSTFRSSEWSLPFRLHRVIMTVYVRKEVYFCNGSLLINSFTKFTHTSTYTQLIYPSIRGEVKEWVQPYIHSPNTPSWCGAQLKSQGQLYLYFVHLYFRSLCIQNYYVNSTKFGTGNQHYILLGKFNFGLYPSITSLRLRETQTELRHISQKTTEDT
jgi:hypothetical protein